MLPLWQREVRKGVQGKHCFIRLYEFKEIPTVHLRVQKSLLNQYHNYMFEPVFNLYMTGTTPALRTERLEIYLAKGQRSAIDQRMIRASARVGAASFPP